MNAILYFVVTCFVLSTALSLMIGCFCPLVP
jgi:hypothetical protein